MRLISWLWPFSDHPGRLAKSAECRTSGVWSSRLWVDVHTRLMKWLWPLSVGLDISHECPECWVRGLWSSSLWVRGFMIRLMSRLWPLSGRTGPVAQILRVQDVRCSVRLVSVMIHCLFMVGVRQLFRGTGTLLMRRALADRAAIYGMVSCR